MSRAHPHRRARARLLPVVRTWVEQLERRQLLHAGHLHADADGHVDSTSGGLSHVTDVEFVKDNPQFAGKDLWNPATFDPKGTGQLKDFLYDPHRIEDTRPVSEQMPDPVQRVDGSGETKGGGGLGTVLGDTPQPGDYLPDMVPLVGGSGGYLQPYIDTTEQPGRSLLRFSTAVGNMGQGPIILTSSNSDVNADGTQNVYQQIYTRTSGTASFTFQRSRLAGKFVWHNGHSHFHYEGYATYRLLTNVGGTPGPVATRSDGSIAIGDKVGFCLINISTSFTIPGTGTSSSTLSGYNVAGQPSTSCGFTQGIHVGRADVYDSIYDGQWIDVTGVAAGNYFLEVTLDGSDTILESNEANNTVLVPVTLGSSTSTSSILPDRFDTVGNGGPNNTAATATNLGEMGVQNQAGLTIHASYDLDFFRFTAASTGSGTLSTTAANGDLNLWLYDTNGTLLKSATTQATGGTETLTYNFVKGQAYVLKVDGFETSTNSTGLSSNYTLAVNIKPSVDASAPTAVGSAASGPAVVRLSRNGPTSSPLTVNIATTGTAVFGTDYVLSIDGVNQPTLPTSVPIGNEASNLDLTYAIKPGAVITADKTITVTVGSSTAYAFGDVTAATITLRENVKPTSTPSKVLTTMAPQYVSFNFSEDVSASLAASDLRLETASGQPVFAPATLTWNPALLRATFTFLNPLPEGAFVARLLSADVTDAAGNPLAASVASPFYFYRGDMNNDGAVNNLDIAPFVQGLTNPAGFQSTYLYTPDLLGDVNRDGSFNNLDISAFVTVLTGGTLTVPATAAMPRGRVALATSDVLGTSTREPSESVLA